MTEKERLVMILDRNFEYTEEEKAELVADRLLDAGVLPVVLCRDCIYAPTAPDDGVESGFDLEWPEYGPFNDNPCPFKCPDRWYSRKPAPDFFCANGKRK